MLLGLSRIHGKLPSSGITFVPSVAKIGGGGATQAEGDQAKCLALGKGRAPNIDFL
jgi:hypothetical protein